MNYPSLVYCQKKNSAKPIFFYLHGRILEDQGSEAFSERFGKYQYTEIVQAFEKTGFRVISEVRLKYAEKVADQIRD